MSERGVNVGRTGTDPPRPGRIAGCQLVDEPDAVGEPADGARQPPPPQPARTLLHLACWDLYTTVR